MPITVRNADLEVDQEIILRTLSKNLPSISDSLDRFNWLYKQNPAGSAQAWLAIDSGTRSCIGVAAAFPRHMLLKGCPETAWVLGDFCLDKPYRSLGPALMLQRKCLEGITSGAVSFFYDFPSQSMMKVYHRLGIGPFAKIIRFAKPLRLDRKVEGFVTNRVFAKFLSKCGNFLIKSLNRKLVVPESLKIIHHYGPFDIEFSKLADEIASSYGVCVVRSAEYLNWRYRDNPLYEYEVLAAYQGVGLVGYLIYRKDGDYATLVDVFALRDPAIIGCLLQGMVKGLYSSGGVSVSAPVVEDHFLGEMLRHHGFIERETVSLVVYGLERLPARDDLAKCAKWFIMEGDRDS